jgi:hypothetical protein
MVSFPASQQTIPNLSISLVDGRHHTLIIVLFFHAGEDARKLASKRPGEDVWCHVDFL